MANYSKVVALAIHISWRRTHANSVYQIRHGRRFHKGIIYRRSMLINPPRTYAGPQAPAVLCPTCGNPK